MTASAVAILGLPFASFLVLALVRPLRRSGKPAGLVSIAADSSSTRMPTVAIGPPSAGIHPHSASTRLPSANTRRARTKAVATARMLTIPAGRPERRSGRTSARTRNATNGSPRTARAEAAIR